MAKRTAALELMLPAREAGTPAFRWLYTSLRGEILAGRLRPGARLPSSRELARQYGLARGTIVGAFEQLAAEGYLEGVVGAGTHVARIVPDDLLATPAPATRAPVPAPAAARPLAGYGRRVGPAFVIEDRPVRAFRSDLPALDHFPTRLWAQIAGRRLKSPSVGDLLCCAPLGYRPLRQAVADYLRTSRGVTCEANQVMIVSGVQEALDLVARLLVDPGDRVLVENPGYLGAAQVFTAIGATVLPIEVDDEGLRTGPPGLPEARLVYVTPAHQYPLGVTLSVARRLALLDWARACGGWIFEDDYDSEYRYSGRPVPALQGLGDGASVLFAGSFNKVLFPSLRLGYLVVPPGLADPFAAARSLAARHPPLLEQKVLVDFLVQGHFGRHLRRMRQLYAERRGVLLECAREYLAGVFELATVEAGLQTAGYFQVPVDAEAVARAVAARGVEVTPLARFSTRPLPYSGLQLGFAAVDGREIRRGIQELAAVLG